MSDQRRTRGGGPEWAPMDRIDAIWWGTSFIWGALVLLFSNTGWPGTAAWWDSWGVYFAGIGLAALVLTVVRLQVPKYRPKWLASLIFAVIFLAIGLGAWGASWWLWVLLLLIAGAATLRSALRQEG